MNTFTEDNLIIHQLPLGPMANFAYIIADAETNEAAIVDPGWEPQALLDAITENKYNFMQVLLTHGHYDHVQALGALLALSGDKPVYLSEKEAPQLTPQTPTLIRMKHNDTLKVGNLSITVIHTPGHSPGCVCFHTGNHLITGDLLFVRGCGRTDLPGGNVNEMFESLGIIVQLPGNTTIYPGHDYGDTPTSMLAMERIHNPFLKASEREQFIRRRK